MQKARCQAARFLLVVMCLGIVRGDDTPYLTHFVAKLPAQFNSGPRDKLMNFAALGPMLLTGKGVDYWQTEWHQLDFWTYNQLNISPRRVYDPQEADVIVVPIAPRLHEFSMLMPFMDMAPSLLPLLGAKPHLITLNHPVHVYDDAAPGVLDHPSARLFTILTMQAEVDKRFPKLYRDRNISNMVIIPNLMQVHWHRGHELVTGANKDKLSFDQIVARKKYLAMFSGKASALHHTVRIGLLASQAVHGFQAVRGFKRRWLKTCWCSCRSDTILCALGCTRIASPVRRFAST